MADEEGKAEIEEAEDTVTSLRAISRAPSSPENKKYSTRVREWGDQQGGKGPGRAPQQPDDGLPRLGAPKRGKVSFGGARASLLTVPENQQGQTPLPKKTTPFSKPKPTASTIQGKRTVRLSVLPVSGPDAVKVRGSTLPGGTIQGGSSRTLSFAPKRLLDIENGKSIVITNQAFLPSGRFQELGEDGAVVVTAKATAPSAANDDVFFNEARGSLEDRILKGEVSDFEGNDEITFLGGAWRGILRRILVHQYDDINGLRLGRQMQWFLPFQTGYETYLLSEVIEAFDNDRIKDINLVLKIAFKNRNASRIIVQQLGARYDFLWHWHTQITRNRWFDAFGQIPLVGFTSFPGSENFPNTTGHALASIFRVVLGEGNWLTRVITGGREAIVTDDPETTAQNLAAESNGFELANRNQFGTYVGRRKTNHFRFEHRLPTDESIVRTFIGSPGPTMLNNGVEHVLRCLAKHFHNMLYQFSGNFAHQRMEQLDPFEILRFHMPVVLVTLSTLRGRNDWDGKVLGPFVRQLQTLKPSFTADNAKFLVRELLDTIIVPVCAGIAARVDPFRSWAEALLQVCEEIENEAKAVYELVSTVEIGIRLGYDLITQVSWKVPTDKQLKEAILNHIRGMPTTGVDEHRIRKAMQLIAPRDKRTLMELVKNNLLKTKPAQLLLGRAKTLLQRELRREALNQGILELSKGEETTDLVHDEWYWLEDGDNKGVYIYDAKVTGRDSHRFLHADTKYERFISVQEGSTKIRQYIPVAESISRAQRAFMHIELDHGKKFSYNALMEFSFLRIALRRLIAISQINCEELDNARLNVLQEIQRSNQVQIGIKDLEPGKTYYVYNGKTKVYEPFVAKKQYSPSDPDWAMLARAKIVKVPPQSIIVIGGGPTGLTTTIHCTENCLVSGGTMKLYEARDAFAKGGSTFERAQIVRLDPRWIAVLRYHLGTGFEDVYIPAGGETDSHLGNTLPTQGFVEITIKDLENMLHVEVSKMWSKGLVQNHTQSGARYDHNENTLSKQGSALKIDDLVHRRVDPNGVRCEGYYTWRVSDIEYSQALGLEQLHAGSEYGIYIRVENAVRNFRLTGVDLTTDTYTFKSLDPGKEDIKASGKALPAIYPKGTTKHADISKIVVECVQKGDEGGYVRDALPYKSIAKEKFSLDIGHFHVIECVGKPHGSKVHFSTTTYEPYGVCCIQGLKVSMGMHNFGEKRWGAGILDDIRSVGDQNTRIIGDFTKMVRSAPVAEAMYGYMTDPKDPTWQLHWKKVCDDNGFPELNAMDPIVPKIQEACKAHAEAAPTFRRQTLQTRFFETGDNYYLGMEFTREYDLWKNNLATEVVAPLMLKGKDEEMKKRIERFRGVVMHHIDRLWYDGCLEVIRMGDVYNPGARHRVPRLYLVNKLTDDKLGSLPVGESFRLRDRPEEKYEVVVKGRSQIVVRNVEGYISKMSTKTIVRRESNLTRQPDGNAESRVALATFPVGHYVNFRTMRLNDASKGYVFVFIGDEQATPHFMRYSGLTGACINAMLFNNFIKQAISGVPFIDRFKLYSKETNWSNGEVVQRGTGANYGVDGFLRPGFPYDHGMDYIHSKVIEYMESEQDLDNIISRDWKVKLAASMVPRGMELNEDFIKNLYARLKQVIMDKFIAEVANDKRIASDALTATLKARAEAMESKREETKYDLFWNEFVGGLNVDDTTYKILEDYHVAIAKRLEQIVNQIVEFATKAYLYNNRISSELENQPKSVDSIVDDFAVEAQNFANALVLSATYSSAVQAFSLFAGRAGEILGAILAGFNIVLGFGTMANSSRYKIRNEEARVVFRDEKYLQVLKGVYSVMDRNSQDSVPLEDNPFWLLMEQQKNTFLKNAKYYDYDEPKEFLAAYREFTENINEPEKIREFMGLITSKFLVDTYHVNSYLQEYLVNIYKECVDLLRFLEQTKEKAGAAEAYALFNRLLKFRPWLDSTLQRGPTRWGFVKKRKVSQWDAVVMVKFFWNALCCASRKGSLPGTPISTETLGIVKQARYVSGLHHSQVLRREIRDLEALYYATNESDIGSLIFMAGFFTFWSNLLATCANIFQINTDSRAYQNFETVTRVTLLATTWGAMLAAFHLVRKFFILVGLYFVLGKKVGAASSTDARDRIKEVRGVTLTQIVLTALRLGAALAAAVALPWSFAEQEFGNQINTDPELPAWIAVGAVGAATLSTVLFFIVEYIIRYNLTTKLGEFVCEAFREEIEAMYKVLELPINDVDAKQVQERDTWEYVTREFLHRYRFDAVFAADRFGSIMQYLQSGMDPR